MTGPLIIPDLFAVLRDADKLPWQPFREGIAIHWLYETGDHGPAAALIRFEPGAEVTLHEHPGFEHIIVLSGSQTDQNAHLKCGALMIHPPGTKHSIVSEEGCIVLAIYERRVNFLRKPVRSFGG
jgi:anti-sigma factor ChrR (cupin superfamily)